MQTYRQYLLENIEASTKHTSRERLYIDSVTINPHSVYYLDSQGHLHNLNGPAVEGSGGRYVYRVWMNHGLRHRLDGPAVTYSSGDQFWYVDGFPLSDPAVSREVKEKCQWKLLEVEIEKNLPILNGRMTSEMQEYICQHRPDLIGNIQGLDPDLAKKYQHEVGLSQVDV